MIRTAILVPIIAGVLVVGGAAAWYFAARDRPQQVQAEEKPLTIRSVAVSPTSGSGPFTLTVSFVPATSVDATILCEATGARGGPQGTVATIDTQAGGEAEAYPTAIPALPPDSYTVRCHSEDGPRPVARTSNPFSVNEEEAPPETRERAGPSYGAQPGGDLGLIGILGGSVSQSSGQTVSSAQRSRTSVRTPFFPGPQAAPAPGPAPAPGTTLTSPSPLAQGQLASGSPVIFGTTAEEQTPQNTSGLAPASGSA